MNGETKLDQLLKSMSPVLLEGEYVFCSIAGAAYGDYADLEPFASCMEPEGLSLVVSRENADAAGLPYDAVFSGITLQVHSSLEAVGLTAAISARLTEQNISANVIAGYFHDHVFVQRRFADQALVALLSLSA